MPFDPDDKPHPRAPAQPESEPLESAKVRAPECERPEVPSPGRRPLGNRALWHWG